jgi:hypothetical protein
MRRRTMRTLRILLLGLLCLGLSGCDDPQVYGSIGFSSYSGGGYYGGGGMGTSISIGGRIR